MVKSPRGLLKSSIKHHIKSRSPFLRSGSQAKLSPAIQGPARSPRRIERWPIVRLGSVHARTKSQYQSESPLMQRHHRRLLLPLAKRFCTFRAMSTAPLGSKAKRPPKRFAPLDPSVQHDEHLPKLKGIIFDVDGTLW